MKSDRKMAIVIEHDNVISSFDPETGTGKRADARACARSLVANIARWVGRRVGESCRRRGENLDRACKSRGEDEMQKPAGPKKQKCKNCEGKGTLKKGDKVVRCQRCNGTGIKR